MGGVECRDGEGGLGSQKGREVSLHVWAFWEHGLIWYGMAWCE